ncbi:hypothetical protein AcW2_000543 [Taiwanofungus camphoratus]|nr:hypothetical protein AcW2_000543 [Antrodia cinnamomea]
MSMAVASGLPELPIETCEHILDHLWDDPRTLAACLHTCRAWVPRCRLHLYRVVTLKGKRRYRLFEKLLWRSPYIASYVRELSIWRPKSNEEISVVDKEWPRILLKLNRVEYLTLKHILMSRLSDDMRQKLATFFPMVKTLRFFGVELGGSEFYHLLCACPNLAEIAFFSSRCRDDFLHTLFQDPHDQPFDHAVLTVVPSTSIRIDTLIYVDTYGPSAPWLLEGALELRLRRLAVRYDQGIVAQKILRAAGASLELLVLAARPMNLKEGYWPEALSLAHNTGLVSLHFTGASGSKPHQFGHPISPRAMRLFLSLLDSSHSRVQRIQISTQFFDPESHLGRVFWFSGLWEQVDEILARLSRERSRLVIIFAMHLVEDFDKQLIADMVTFRLPMLLAGKHRLGVFCGQCWDDDAAFGGDVSHPRREYWFESS